MRTLASLAASIAAAACVVSGLAADLQAALTITSNPSGLAAYSPNPYASASLTTDLNSVENNLAYDRSLNNGARTRAMDTTNTATTGYFEWTNATGFNVGTIIVGDWSYPGWGGTLKYGVTLDGVDTGINRSALIDKSLFIYNLPGGIIQTDVNTTRFNFTQLQDDRSATVFEAWLLPKTLTRLNLTGASVTGAGDNQYPSSSTSSRDLLFNLNINDEYLVHGSTIADERSMTFDLGGTQNVGAFFLDNSHRDMAAMVSYFDGAWHNLVGLSGEGDASDVIMLSSPILASQLKITWDWSVPNDGWVGPREFQVFTVPLAAVPEPAGIAVLTMAIVGALAQRRRARRIG